MDCHRTEYDRTADPNHVELQLSQNCEDCHSTNPDWKPAEFAIHDQYYLLSGGHAVIANDCSSCHASGYTNTSDQCIDCHRKTFNSAINPNHVELQ